MKLFLNDFRLFFDNSSLKIISNECLKRSEAAFQVKNGNIPKWTKAIDIANALPKGKGLGRRSPSLCHMVAARTF